MAEVAKRTSRRQKAVRLKNNAAAWLSLKWLERKQPRAVELIEWARVHKQPVKEMQNHLAERIASEGCEPTATEARAAVDHLFQYYPKTWAAKNLHVATMRALALHDLPHAIRFGEHYLDILDDVRALRSLIKYRQRTHDFRRALELCDRLGEEANEARAYIQILAEQRRIEEVLAEDIEKAIAAGSGALDELAVRAVAEADNPLAAHRMMMRLALRELRANKRYAEELIRHAEPIQKAGLPEKKLHLHVCDAWLHLGDLARARQALEHVDEEHAQAAAAKRRRVDAFAGLREKGFAHPLPVPASAADEHSYPVPGRVLWPLHNSLPHDSGGYATRTHGLLTALRDRGWRVRAASRLGYPQDRPKHRDKPLEEHSIIDGAHYHRLYRKGSGYGEVPIDDYLRAYTEELYELCKQLRPEILHAPANYMNGVAANEVGRALGIPTIYEVRGLWEVTRISRQPDWKHSEYYEMMSRMEAQAARQADRVTCLTSALRDEMVSRGVPYEKITLVPNGVNAARFLPRDRNEALAAELGLSGKRVIGYIGSVVDYEGLDDLLRAAELLRNKRSDFGVLIVGDGAVLEAVRNLADQLHLNDLVRFTGRVPHEQVEDYYSLIDVAPFPRKSLPVTEMVSPLKPFEAMAMNKTVVSSNVAALAEIVQDGINGYLFDKDNVDSLAEVLDKALDPDASLGDRPRQWVVENRSWEVISGTVTELYRELTHPLQPAVQVSMSDVKLIPEVSEVLDQYRDHYADSSPAHLRRDDYARWSEVAKRIRHETSVLDVGVGAGQLVNVLARRGTFERVVGLDRRPHSKFLELNQGFTMEYASIEKLPFAGGEFDVVTCLETIEHLPEAIFEPGIVELRRVCRRQLLVTVPFRERKLGSGHLRRFDFADIERLFPAASVVIYRRTKGDEETYWALIEETYG